MRIQTLDQLKAIVGDDALEFLARWEASKLVEANDIFDIFGLLKSISLGGQKPMAERWDEVLSELGWNDETDDVDYPTADDVRAMMPK